MAEGAAQATKSVPGAAGRLPAAGQARAHAGVARRMFSEPGEAAERSAGARSMRAMVRSASRVPVHQPRSLHRAPAWAAGGSGTREVPQIVHDVLRSAGQPLDFATRAFMEPRFGTDFSSVPAGAAGPAHIAARPAVGAPHDRFECEADAAADRVTAMPEPNGQNRFDLGHVRVHTDATAAESARQLNAYAYTIGHHVVFAAGEYAPHTGAGRNLLAHELSHVVQQTAASPAGGAAAPLVQHRPIEPRLQGKWRLDRVFVDDNPEINYIDDNGVVKEIVVGTDASPGAGLVSTAQTWQETGFVHQKVGGKAQLAHSIRKRYIFKNDGQDGDYLQLRPFGNISGNAKAEDLQYARGGSVVWGRIRERTAANPDPPDTELFRPLKDGAISAATVGDLGVIEAEIPIGERGTIHVTIPLKKVDEGTFAPYSGSTTPSHETPSSYDEVEVSLGGRVEADAEIQTAFFGVAPWLSRNYNTAHANALFRLDWNSVAAPAPRPGATGASPGTESGTGVAGRPAVAGGGGGRRPDVFRMGNTSSPRIDNVRVPTDIKPDAAGNVTGPGQGGASSSADPRSEKPWWKYPMTASTPDRIVIRNDHTTHWQWEPDGTMPLGTYIDRLRASIPNWVRTWS